MVGRGYCPRPVASTRCRGSARPEKPVAEVASAGVSPRGCSRLLANAIVAGSPPRRRAAGGHGGRHMYGGLPLFRALATWPGPLPKFGGWAQFQTGSDPRGVAATPGVPTRKLPAAQSQQACVVDPLDPRQSGNTRLVIALLQSGDVLELRIQELSPEMSDVGSNHEEALHLQQQHQQVLQKLQNKQSPVEELLSQADELIANQKPKAQVYSAMAHNLGLAWKNLNAQLEHRSIVLDTAVQYHAAAKKLSDELAKGEQEFSDTVLPDHVAACEARLQKLNEARKAILEASKRSLQPFQNLLQTLKEVANTGDSRPLQPAAALAAIAALESQHENLQDQRRKLGLLCEARKEALEKRLKALLLNKELDEVGAFPAGKHRANANLILGGASTGAQPQRYSLG
ncbi:hypothetical protein MRX96_041532 [Rhipicephalus microplus]